MMECGTTTLEAKSGYGLDTATELKMLRVLQRAREESRLEISGTYCGAHAVPKGASAAEAMDNVIYEQIPALKREKNAGRLDVMENIDVFCEKGVFAVHQTRKILMAGRQELNLVINFHAEELNRLNSAEMGAEIGSQAMSHLEEVRYGREEIQR